MDKLGESFEKGRIVYIKRFKKGNNHNGRIHLGTNGKQ